jgi:large subunit ribosomal protein L10
MSKPVKELITENLASRYGDESNAVWVEMTGIDGITTNQFRRELRGNNMRLEVVKTSLLRRACAEGPLAPLAQALSGPAALVTGGDSPIEVAKLLEDWLPRFPKNTLRIRGAVLDGEYLDEERVQSLAKMESKADLRAKLAAIILTPGGKLVAAALGPGANVAGLLKALIGKLEDGEEIARTSAAAAPEKTD